jgi:hypothetical protein
VRDSFGGDRRPCRSILTKENLECDEERILTVHGEESPLPVG